MCEVFLICCIIYYVTYIIEMSFIKLLLTPLALS